MVDFLQLQASMPGLPKAVERGTTVERRA